MEKNGEGTEGTPEEIQGVNLCGNTLENTQKLRSPTPHLNR